MDDQIQEQYDISVGKIFSNFSGNYCLFSRRKSIACR